MDLKIQARQEAKIKWMLKQELAAKNNRRARASLYRRNGI